MSIDENTIAELEEDVEEGVSPASDEVQAPDFFSEEWHDYVMTQFRDDELENGNPVRDGLVRVCQNLIGPVAGRQIISFIGPSRENHGTATVHIRFTFKVTNTKHPLYGQLIIEDGIAEVNRFNTPEPYSNHPAASASTKAEGQACRKALNLRKVVSADEITPDEGVMSYNVFTPDEPLTEEHINILDLLCQRVNVNLLEFVNSGEKKYAHVNQIPTSTVQRMIKFLSEVQSGHKEAPKVKAYNPNWRIKDGGVEKND